MSDFNSLAAFPGGVVSPVLFEQAISFIASIDKQADELVIIEEEDAFSVLKQKHADLFEAAERIIRLFGEQIRPSSLENMQKVFYSFTSKHSDNHYFVSVCTYTVNSLWNGIGEWKR